MEDISEWHSAHQIGAWSAAHLRAVSRLHVPGGDLMAGATLERLNDAFAGKYVLVGTEPVQLSSDKVCVRIRSKLDKVSRIILDISSEDELSGILVRVVDFEEKYEQESLLSRLEDGLYQTQFFNFPFPVVVRFKATFASILP